MFIYLIISDNYVKITYARVKREAGRFAQLAISNEQFAIMVVRFVDARNATRAKIAERII